MISRVSTQDLSVFKTFTHSKLPSALTIQSRQGDYSLLEELPDFGLSIVGTRYPQQRSIEILEDTFRDLKNTNLIIISGIARGIDSKAHELALKHGLRTIAFLGCGIDVDYPRENHRLKSEIIQSGGLIISQFEDDCAPFPGNFLERNVLIAGFSKATWVVEAAEVSGSLNTANHASGMNRDLYVTSCFPKDHYYQGNVKLLSQRKTDRYPLAHPFFGVECLGMSWAELASKKSGQTEFTLRPEPKTELQNWILTLQANAGECKIQSLMSFAGVKGYTPGQFYKIFEKELDAGFIQHSVDGRVEIII